VSFGSILTPIGVFLLTYGFGSFFQLLPGADVAAILLIYGFPITLLGFALSYAQLRPVPCKSTREGLALRDSQATDIQKQARPGCCGTAEPASGESTAREGQTISAQRWLKLQVSSAQAAIRVSSAPCLCLTVTRSWWQAITALCPHILRATCTLTAQCAVRHCIHSSTRQAPNLSLWRPGIPAT